MTTATNILKSFDEQSVHIDYLCFTFAVKDLRHCHDAVRRLHKHEEYKGFAKPGLLQRHCTCAVLRAFWEGPALREGPKSGANPRICITGVNSTILR